jgi:hypothetical protein
MYINLTFDPIDSSNGFVARIMSVDPVNGVTVREGSNLEKSSRRESPPQDEVARGKPSYALNKCAADHPSALTASSKGSSNFSSSSFMSIVSGVSANLRALDLAGTKL